MSIQAGELNKKISIITQAASPNTNGFETEPEVTYYSTFAKIENLNGIQEFKSGALYDKSITKFTVRFRYDKSILTTMRVRYKTGLFKIIDINNIDEVNEFIEITGEVVTNG